MIEENLPERDVFGFEMEATPVPITEIASEEKERIQVGIEEFDRVLGGGIVYGSVILVGGNPGNFYYVGGTSMATPHVAAVAALMLQKNPTLMQTQVESILKTTALSIPVTGSQSIFDFDHWATIAWDTDCNGAPCDAVGAGLMQADQALAAVP